MKPPPYLLRTLVASVFGAVLASDPAAAQVSYYYSDGSAGPIPGGAIHGGSLASIGFDAYQTNNDNPNISDDGLVGASNDGLGYKNIQNYIMPGLATTLGDGSTLDSVTLVLWVDGLIPNSPSSYELYENVHTFENDLLSQGSQVGTITPLGYPSYYSFTVSAAVLAGGFSVSTDTPDFLFNAGSELNNDPTRTPLVIAHYTAAVPEPSTSILGALGTLALMRRRRA